MNNAQNNAKRQAERREDAGAKSGDFGTLQDVLDYLHGKGLKVSIRTLKRKSRDGTLYKGRNGWTQASVDALALLLAPDAGTAPCVEGSAEQLRDLAQEKLKKQILKLQAQSAQIKLDFDISRGRLIPKTRVWQALAQREGYFFTVLKQDMLALIPALCRTAREQGQEQTEATFWQGFNEALARGLQHFSRQWTQEELGETWTNELDEEDLQNLGASDRTFWTL